MAPVSSTVANLEFRLRVARKRKALRMSGSEVANSLSFSRNHWSMIENGRSLIARNKLESLLSLFKFGDQDRVELIALDTAARDTGWWVEALGEDNPIISELCGLEHGATSIRAFETLTVPGLFQTREYASAVISKDPIVGQLDLNRMVEVRDRRQQRLVDDDPIEFTVILPEAALVHRVKDAQVQSAQLHKIHELCCHHDNVTLHILPFEHHPGPLANASTLLLFDFESDHLPTLAWQEGFTGVGPIDKTRQVERIELAWSDAMRNSLDSKDSLVRLIEIAEALAT